MKKRRAIIIPLCAVAAVILTAAIVFSLTPVPVSLLIRKAFESPKLTPPDGYAEIEANVTAYRDIEYPSAHGDPSVRGDNALDLYLPKDEIGDKLPVIIWVHGGAFVGGDKSDARFYCTTLANDGYAVISMNYARAPEALYPTPVLQIGEVCEWLTANAGAYSLDSERIILAGDSAGAHSAAQFALIQTNPEYANLISIPASVPGEHIKGLLLYCGPYDMRMTANMESSLFGFFINQAAWAYLGARNWEESYDRILTIENHITPNFPPVFITDGNTASFELQGMRLAAALEGIGVSVSTYFVPRETEKTAHEFQFQMSTPAGVECYGRTLGFLRERQGIF